MAEPAAKAPEVDEALDLFSSACWGRNRSTSIVNDICVICGSAAKDFRDALSRKEYTISGMCQRCQDITFTEPADDDDDTDDVI